MEDICRILDEIMKLNHEVVGYYIKLADNEILRKPKDKLLNETIRVKTDKIKQLYLDLEVQMQEIGLERTKDKYEKFSITLKNPDKVEDDIIVDVREDILDYIKESYIQMNFISDEERDEISIYDGTLEQNIRETEFDTYKNNIASIENRQETDDTQNISKLGYIQIAKIIEDMADNVMYEKAAKRIEKVIGKLENGQFTFNSSSEKARTRNKLIYMKYNEQYKDVNQKNNGLIAGSIHKGLIETTKKMDSLYLVLGLDKSDYDKLYESRICEKLDDTKEDVKLVFKQGRDEITEKRISRTREIGESISKLIKSKIEHKSVEIPTDGNR